MPVVVEQPLAHGDGLGFAVHAFTLGGGGEGADVHVLVDARQGDPLVLGLAGPLRLGVRVLGYFFTIYTNSVSNSNFSTFQFCPFTNSINCFS